MQQISNPDPRIIRVLIASFFWGIGGNLSWMFLNFHLKAIGFSNAQIGYANAMPGLAAVLFSIPLAFLIPRLGYVRSLLLGGGIAILGMLLVASGWAVYPGLLLGGIGQGLVMGSVAPLLAQLVDAKRQVGLFTWQQSLVAGAGFLGAVLGGQLPGLVGTQNVMYAVALAYIISSLFVWGLPEARGQSDRFAFRNPRNWLLLLIPQTLVGLGAGLTLPFLNLYLQAKFGLSYNSIGWLFAVTSITAMAALAIQPMLARKLGKVGAITAVQAVSLPFLMILAWAPWLPLVTAALFVRGALMNSTGPVYTALVMDNLDEEERAGFLLIQGAVWQLTAAVSSSISGQVQEAMGLAGFNYLFAAMLVLYSLSIIYYPLFFKPRARQTRHEVVPQPGFGQSGD